MTDYIPFEQALQVQIEHVDEFIREESRGMGLSEIDISIMVNSMQAGLKCALETYRKYGNG